MSLRCDVCRALVDKAPTQMEQLISKIFCSDQCFEEYIEIRDNFTKIQKKFCEEQMVNVGVHDLTCSYCNAALKGFTCEEAEKHISGCIKKFRANAGSSGTELAKEIDAVNHPAHYNSHPSGVECIAVTEHMNYNVGNAMKYLWRSKHKNGIKDLRKARWYVDREIKRLERDG